MATPTDIYAEPREITSPDECAWYHTMDIPGPGIGGYCLPKDGGLGVWANKHIRGWQDDIFKITPLAIDINDTRALHVAQLVRDALRNMGRPIAADVLLLGAVYREDVGDTRYSGVGTRIAGHLSPSGLQLVAFLPPAKQVE